MATVTANINIVVSVSWWVPIYVRTVCILCQFFDAEPDYDKVRFWVSKGIKTRMVLSDAKK